MLKKIRYEIGRFFYTQRFCDYLAKKRNIGQVEFTEEDKFDIIKYGLAEEKHFHNKSFGKYLIYYTYIEHFFVHEYYLKVKGD